jgi:multiple sugar transport system substrate-binding protein
MLLASCAPPPAAAPAAPAEQAAPTQAAVATAAPAVQGEAIGVGGDATGVKYEKKDQLYGGNPITLQIWDWHTPRVTYWEEKTKEYTKMYPNVTFEITQIAGDDYWTKLVAALPAGQGPDIYHFHNSNHTPYIENNLIEPFPPEMFEPNFLKENWIGFQEGHYMDKEGRIRYLPYGAMAALVYVNQKMWDDAGLTEKDYPKTWADMMELGKKLTKYDAAGNIDIAGMDFNGYIQYLFNDMNFQQGRYMYTKDGKGCQVDTPEGRNSWNTLQKVYDEKISSPQFLEWLEAFGTQKSAMAWSWTWFSGYMRETYPDVKFFTLPMPGFEGTELPAAGRQNYEVSLVVSPAKDLERRKVSWDFMHWLYSNEENLVDLALVHNVVPAYKKLWTNPRVQADQTIAQLAKVIEYKVFPGEFPSTMDKALTQYIGQNFVSGVGLDQAMEEAQTACDQAMQEKDYWTVERTYLHDDAMIANQP